MPVRRGRAYVTRRPVVRRRIVKKRAYTRPARKPTVRKLAGQVQKIQKQIKTVTATDTYDISGTTGMPQNGVYPWFVALTSPATWSRTFGLFGTSDLENKERVKLNSITMRLKFSMNGATGKAHKVHAYVVSLTKQGKAVFPTGLTNGGFTVGQTHIANDGLNQVMLNKELFRIHKTWTFIIGTIVDGAGNAITDIPDSCREFRWFKATNFMIENTLETWKTQVDGDLPVSHQLYLMVYSTVTTGYNNPFTNPQLDYQVLYRISSGN